MNPELSRTPLRDLTTYGRGRAARLPDCDYRGEIDLHVVLCADGGAPFAKGKVAAMVAENIGWYCRKVDFRLYGFTIMPDHVHILLSPGASEHSLADWLQRFKSFTTNQYKKMSGEKLLWQRSAYDRVCRSGETAERVLEYIVNNPVLGGLVDDWLEWPWTRVFIKI